MHTMTADCWLPKAPRPRQSTNESSDHEGGKRPGSEVRQEVPGGLVEQAVIL